MAGRRRSVNVTAEIQRATERFAAEIQGILGRLAAERNAEVIDSLEAAKAALGGGVSQGARARRAAAGSPKARRGRVSSQEAQEAVYSALQEMGAPVGMAALTKATQLGASSVRGALKVLRDGGLVGHEGDKRSTVYFTAETEQGGVIGAGAGKAVRGRRKAKRSKRS